ncbi:PRTRC system ParB family protein [Geomonas subterranea]|uniref:PRTRC system ParB family protein n=1 Tax=Geomonas subterranea TaxID=2847989 RepID=UPI001CD53E95|nr:PRTRC system ParB family protein [Geomonas fuzhouensis]
MQTTMNDEMIRIPLSLIFKGDNPRKHFDQGELEELTTSVLAKGVIQPIVVRPLNGGEGYAIIAGERRYRAAVAAFGIDGYEIPAVVKDISEEEADELALIENIHRADMSITEEAESAGKILKNHNDDRNEAAAVLGWPLSKFNRRIALLNLIPEAMTALNERRLLVGHAELLAAVPQESQAKALTTIIEHALTVQQVKELLVKASTAFANAIFDLQGCQQCHHNSSQQACLFVESIGEGNCTNRACFEQKTSEKIEAIRAELAEEVQTVRVIEVGMNGFIKLASEGPLGVGPEQYEQCKACANFGATVSNLPNDRGAVERSICFDSGCAQKMVAERIKAEKVAAEAKESTKEKVKTEGGTTEGTSNAPQEQGGNAAEKKEKTKAPAKVAALSQKIVEYRRKNVWEPAAKKELAAAPAKARAFIFDLLLTGDANLVNKDNLTAIYGKIAGNAHPDAGRYCGEKVGHPELPYELSADQQDKLFSAAAVSAVSSSNFPEKRLRNLLKFLDTDLTKHFTLGEELLTLLTKSEIEAVCSDLALDGHVADFKKQIGGKKDEAIKAILAAKTFTFEGAVPSILNY